MEKQPDKPKPMTHQEMMQAIAEIGRELSHLRAVEATALPVVEAYRALDQAVHADDDGAIDAALDELEKRVTALGKTLDIQTRRVSNSTSLKHPF